MMRRGFIEKLFKLFDLRDGNLGGLFVHDENGSGGRVASSTGYVTAVQMTLPERLVRPACANLPRPVAAERRSVP